LYFIGERFFKRLPVFKLLGKEFGHYFYHLGWFPPAGWENDPITITCVDYYFRCVSVLEENPGAAERRVRFRGIFFREIPRKAGGAGPTL